LENLEEDKAEVKPKLEKNDTNFDSLKNPKKNL